MQSFAVSEFSSLFSFPSTKPSEFASILSLQKAGFASQLSSWSDSHIGTSDTLYFYCNMCLDVTIGPQFLERRVDALPLPSFTQISLVHSESFLIIDPRYGQEVSYHKQIAHKIIAHKQFRAIKLFSVTFLSPTLWGKKLRFLFSQHLCQLPNHVLF